MRVKLVVIPVPFHWKPNLSYAYGLYDSFGFADRSAEATAKWPFCRLCGHYPILQLPGLK